MLYGMLDSENKKWYPELSDIPIEEQLLLNILEGHIDASWEIVHLLSLLNEN